MVGGARPDPTFNRLGRIVEKAASQFDAVNPDRAVPNILVIVNHDDASDVRDLRETLTGMFHAEDGSRHPIARNVSEGKIRELKFRIDLYVWIDGESGKVHGYLCSESIPAHVDSLCGGLGLDRSKLSR